MFNFASNGLSLYFYNFPVPQRTSYYKNEVFLNLCLMNYFFSFAISFSNLSIFRSENDMSCLMLKFLNWSGGFFSLFRFFIKEFLTIASGNTIFAGLILPFFLPRRVDLQVTSRSTINVHKFSTVILSDSLLRSWRLKTIILFTLSTRSLIDRDIWDGRVETL